MKRSVISLLFYIALSHISYADSFYVDKNEIKINERFAGATINLYGIHDQKGQIVVVMKGERETYYIQKKEKILGVWVKGERKTFNNVYLYYNVTSEHPLESLHMSYILKQFQIGLENIIPNSASVSDAIDTFEYKNAFFSYKIAKNLFVENNSASLVNPENLVYLKYFIPRNIPEGKYIISVYVIHNGKIISISNIPISIYQVGILKFMKETSRDNKTLYFALSIFVSIGFSAFGFAILNGTFTKAILALKDQITSIIKHKPSNNKAPSKRKRGRPRKHTK